MNDKLAEVQKNNAIWTVKLFANDAEFIQQLLASLHVSSDDMTIRRVALDAYIKLDAETRFPDLTQENT